MSVEDIFSRVRQAVFRNLHCIDRLALLVDVKSTGELRLLQTGSRRPDSALASDDSWISQTIVRRVFAERRAIQTSDALLDVRFEEQSSIILKKIGAVLAVPLWNEDQVVGVLFADIVGFTALAEALPPEKISALLNCFFSEMTELVFAEEGTLDKFVGDCVCWELPV